MKILLPVDGTPTALEAVHHALALVRAGLKASFVLANVQDTPTLYEIVTAQDPEVIDEVRRGAAADLIAPAAALLDGAGVEYEVEVASGDPAHTLVDIAERLACDAIVIGAERRGGIASVLIGSVSQSLIHDSPVPVTVVHRRDAGEGGEGEGADADVGEG
jgi:nucleotide-binding universal stress UspA family protein